MAPDGAGTRVKRWARRRDEYEILGLLLGIGGILLVLTVTLGVAPPF
jgi:hypothetical protein